MKIQAKYSADPVGSPNTLVWYCTIHTAYNVGRLPYGDHLQAYNSHSPGDGKGGVYKSPMAIDKLVKKLGFLFVGAGVRSRGWNWKLSEKYM